LNCVENKTLFSFPEAASSAAKTVIPEKRLSIIAMHNKQLIHLDAVLFRFMCKSLPKPKL